MKITILLLDRDIWIIYYPKSSIFRYWSIQMAKHHEVTKQNPWWKHGKNFINFEPLIGGKHFTRKECPLERGNIYMLRGPRQVGKTIYIRDTISKLMEKGVNAKDIFRLSVDFFPSRRELRSAVENFLISTRDSGRIYIFLDEITSLEDWHLELKYLSDQRIKDKAVIFVTGSSPKRLRELSDSIPGRGLEGNEYYLKPLSFRQFAIQAIEYIMRFSSQIESEFRASLEKLNEALTKFEIDLDME
ncbi:MAG: AAA family ATPase, partial [Deltaproteobacteria bacterium]|nr:AAA family ATPase [Deltaproteobacteria bacterium]